MTYPRATVFLSYSWDDKPLARALAAGLEARGFYVWIDEGELRAGDSIVERVSEAIGQVDFLVALVSQVSIGSNWCRKEISLAMTSELKTRDITVIPLRVGDVPMPSTLVDKVYISIDPHDTDAAVTKLAYDLERHLAPATPMPPHRRTSSPRHTTSAPRIRRETSAETGPIRLTGIDQSGITSPRSDGSRDSAVYAVPFTLSRRPDATWAELLVRNWDHPPSWTTMHRRGIARVAGDRIILDDTTIDEVKNYHLDTLKLAVQVTNKQAEQRRQQVEAARKAEEEAAAQHRAAVDAAVDGMKFG